MFGFKKKNKNANEEVNKVDSVTAGFSSASNEPKNDNNAPASFPANPSVPTPPSAPGSFTPPSAPSFGSNPGMPTFGQTSEDVAGPGLGIGSTVQSQGFASSPLGAMADTEDSKFFKKPVLEYNHVDLSPYTFEKMEINKNTDAAVIKDYIRRLNHKKDNLTNLHDELVARKNQIMKSLPPKSKKKVLLAPSKRVTKAKPTTAKSTDVKPAVEAKPATKTTTAKPSTAKKPEVKKAAVAKKPTAKKKVLLAPSKKQSATSKSKKKN